MTSEAIRIVVVDDHLVVRVGLTQIIAARDDMMVIAETETGEEALFLCHKLNPDIVLMDVRMHGMGGIAATEAIKRYHPDVRVIALSTFDDRSAVERMLAAGACGFLLKTVSAQDLINAIIRVYQGETVIDPTIAPRPDAALPASDPDNESVGLGSQQRRVLALLTKGYTNSEIAGYMNISMPTARYHVSAILLKLGVSNRAEAAAMAVRHNLIEPTDF